MRFGSLFTGIGGIDLGLERAGMECAWQVENDPYCIKVLEKHWPNIRRYEDVKTGTNPAPGDLLAGGFPCQPHSVAGKRRGAEDDRNLWPEYLRLIRETKPRYILAENVPGIVSTYIDTVLSDMESEGYTCWAFNIPACAFDAPHRRERIFIVAVTERNEHKHTLGGSASVQKELQDKGGEEHCSSGQSRRTNPVRQTSDRHVAYADNARSRTPISGCGERPQSTHWTTEPDVGRVANGVPNRIHKLRGLGNAVVPQVAEWIGQRIMEHSNER